MSYISDYIRQTNGKNASICIYYNNITYTYFLLIDYHIRKGKRLKKGIIIEKDQAEMLTDAFKLNIIECVSNPEYD
jgi:hypothetical protein